MSLLRRWNPLAQARRINGLLKIVKHLNEGCQKSADEIAILKKKVDEYLAVNIGLMTKLHNSVIENNKLKVKLDATGSHKADLQSEVSRHFERAENLKIALDVKTRERLASHETATTQFARAERLEVAISALLEVLDSHGWNSDDEFAVESIFSAKNLINFQHKKV